MDTPSPAPSEHLMAVLARAYPLDLKAPIRLVGVPGRRVFRAGQWIVKRYELDRLGRVRVRSVLDLQVRLAASGLPVAAPEPTITGARWIEDGGGLYVVTPLLAGQRRTCSSLALEDAAALGATLAALHQALAALAPAPDPPAIPATDTIRARWRRFAGRAQTVPKRSAHAFDDLVVRMAALATAVLPDMPPVDWSRLRWQTCHNDLYLDTVRFGAPGQVSAVLDWDHAGPAWRELEVMATWNLCLCADPSQPVWSPQADAYVAAYRAQLALPEVVWRELPRAYLHALLTATWPLQQRYAQPGQVAPVWMELLEVRYRTAQWLAGHYAEVEQRLST